MSAACLKLRRTASGRGAATNFKRPAAFVQHAAASRVLGFCNVLAELHRSCSIMLATKTPSDAEEAAPGGRLWCRAQWPRAEMAALRDAKCPERLLSSSLLFLRSVECRFAAGGEFKCNMSSRSLRKWQPSLQTASASQQCKLFSAGTTLNHTRPGWVEFCPVPVAGDGSFMHSPRRDWPFPAVPVLEPSLSKGRSSSWQ